jgi:hypothetical protein
LSPRVDLPFAVEQEVMLWAYRRHAEELQFEAHPDRCRVPRLKELKEVGRFKTVEQE